MGKVASPAGDVAHIAILAVLLPALGILGLAAFMVLLLPPPVGRAFPLLLFPLGALLLGGGVALLLVSREQARVAHNQALFLAQAAHDLRAPLATLRLVAEELSGREPATGERVLACCQLLEEEVRRLLDWGRLATRKVVPRLRPLPFSRVLAASQQRVQGSFQARGQRLAVRGDLREWELLGDEEMLVSALTNLLTNASKYGPRGQEVQLEVAEEKGFLRVAVRDRGPGIAPEEQRKIFRMFYRGKGSQEVEGFGLGLATVLQTARLHRGEVWVESTLGQGSTFILKLPLRATLERGS